MTAADNPFTNPRDRLFHGLEAATCCVPADEDEGLYERSCFPLTDDEMGTLVKAGVLAAALGCYGLTEAGWELLRSRMRACGVVKGPAAYPDDF